MTKLYYNAKTTADALGKPQMLQDLIDDEGLPMIR